MAGLLCLATSCSTKQDTGQAEPHTGGQQGTAMAGTSSVAGAAMAVTSSVAGAAPDNDTAGAPSIGETGGTGGAPGAGGADSTPGGAEPTGGSNELPAAGAPSTSGAGGAAAELPHITSSQAVGVLTVDDFTALCDQRAGTVEVMPHCGGFASAKGFSYDMTTELLSEHTCMGANTCAGWNCVVPD